MWFVCDGLVFVYFFFFFFFKQKTAYEMCGRDWSSDVCSSDLGPPPTAPGQLAAAQLGPGGTKSIGPRPVMDVGWGDRKSVV